MNKPTYFEVCGIAYSLKNFDERRFYYRYALFSNAVKMAKSLSDCDDVFTDVDIIDMTTGEVVATYKNGEQTYTSEYTKDVLSPL